MKAAAHLKYAFRFPRKLLTCTLCVLIPVGLLHYSLLHSFPFPFPFPFAFPSASPSPSFPPPARDAGCDYSAGSWVRDPRGPLYNGTSCPHMKPNQNCMAHGRPDSGYLFWRWRPSQPLCPLPRFDPLAFLRLLSHRHLAFVGDSLARNQAESLLCLLASLSPSPPRLLSAHGPDNRYRRYLFPSHNATLSIYWSPFLLHRIEKSDAHHIRHNRVFLDAFDHTWMRDLPSMHIISFSLGHWFLIPGIYYDNGHVIGCHVCPEFNHTEIGFFDVFRTALRRTLHEVHRRHVDAGEPHSRLVTVTTFTQAHFKGDWDKAGSCSETKPYKEGEVQMEYTAGEMRTSVLQALDAISKTSNSRNLQFAAVDVTRLAMLRPDGHPGPYMYPNPFGSGKAGDRVQNDCVHWCMPGPVDTFNELLWQRIAQSGLFS